MGSAIIGTDEEMSPLRFHTAEKRDAVIEAWLNAHQPEGTGKRMAT